MAFAFVLIGAMIVFGAYWSTMYFLETAPAKTPSTSTTKKPGTRRTTTRRTTTVIQDEDDSDDELSCKDGDCFDKKVKLKEEERNLKSQNSSQNNTTTYLVPTTALSIANLGD
ncbi:hypothetical protein B5X24_HaOG216771 [Helicoverpa armigera]|nr:hypothetical protein B5X24_HaOG216771 [Helicoverpa armigera]